MLDNTAKEVKPKKKIVAREYLIFLTCFVIGVNIYPLADYVSSNGNLSKAYREIVSGLLGGRNFGEAWIVVLFPYIFISLIRSIMWALRTFFYK